jgi:hypothetical protein
MILLLQRLRRLLGIEPGEGRLVGWSAATLFLVEWASVSVSNASDTLFLKRVGVEYLPIVFLVNSVLLTGTTLAAGRWAARVDPSRLLVLTFAGLAAALVGLWALVVAGAPGIATTLVIASKQIDVIALLMFWTMIGSLLSSRQGKRLVALMTAGGTVGTIAGSFLSASLGRVLGIPALLGVAAAALLAAAAAARPLALSSPPKLYRSAARAMPVSPPRAKLASLWAESSLFRILAGTSFLAGVLGPMLYYEFSCAADLATRTADGEQRLLGLYGQLRGWINVGVLAVQVAGSAALFERVGVPLMATLAPAAYLAGFAGLAVRFGLPTAMPATMGTSVLDHTVYEPALRILASLLPQRIRTAATSVIQGPAKRAGAALGSLLILALVAWKGDPSLVALAALPIAGLWMVLALLLWRGYPNLLLEAASVHLRESGGSDPVEAVLDAGTRRLLARHLVSEDPELCLAACSLLAEAPAPAATEALATALLAAPADNFVPLVQALDRVLDRAAAAKSMASIPERVATDVLATLERRSDLSARERAVLLHLLGLLLAGRGKRGGLKSARTAIEAARAERGIGVAARLAAWRIGFGDGEGEDFDAVLGEALGSSDPVASWAAIAELTAVAAEDPSAASRFAPAMLALVDDADERVRSAVLRFVGRAGLVAHAGLLAERLSSRVEAEARAAREALELLGPAAADALLHALRHGGRRAREVAPEMLRDLRADPAVLGRVIDREIDAGRELLVVLGVLDASPMSRLVVQRLRERVDEGMQAVLDLLATVRGDERIAGIGRSLGRAWNVRDRAVLLEALEALLPATERARILPLLEDQSAQRLGVAAAKALGRRWPTLEEALAEALASHDPLTTALVAATADRRLLLAAVPELDVDAALRILSQEPAGVDRAQAPATESPEERPMLSPVETMLHLQTLDLFEALTTRQLAELARIVREVTFPDGSAIVTEGEFDDSMYFIVSGAVDITKGGMPVAELGTRDFFGEMAVFDGERRSATATARGDVRLLRLSRSDLFEVMEDQPAIGIGICQTLVRRVRGLLDARPAAPESET